MLYPEENSTGGCLNTPEKKKKKSSGLKKGLLALTIFNTPENLRVNETKCYFSTGKKQF